MKLASFLWTSSRSALIAAIVAGIVGGLSNAGIIGLISEVITNTDPSMWGNFTWQFFGLCALALVSGALAQVLLIRLSQGTILQLRMQLVRQIMATPLRQFESIGAHRLLAVLTEDVNILTQSIVVLPMLFINIAIVIGIALYLAWIAPLVLLAVVVVMVLGFVSIMLPSQFAERYMKRAREEEDSLFRFFRDLTDGMKELLLHRRRRAVFTQGVEEIATSFRQNTMAGLTILFIVGQWGLMLFFVLIGVLLFVLPNIIALDAGVLKGSLLFLLYMISPLLIILGVFPTFGQANVVLQKIESLGLSIVTPLTDIPKVDEPIRTPTWKQLDLVDVTHTYHREREDSLFTLGPISLTLTPGELVFLVGGNGSGKTTLAKLLIGLYLPESGEIRIDGQPVTDANREDYRQLFSVVFTDFYLFESLMGLHSPSLDSQARVYLAQLHIDHKVQIQDGVLSTIELSQGQRKRLALLTAYLEDRPFYLFDEWAADQDPIFKEIFYTQLLPDLKRRQKTVLVITHDDKYFHLADRLIKLDYGQVSADYRLLHTDGTAEIQDKLSIIREITA